MDNILDIDKNFLSIIMTNICDILNNEYDEDNGLTIRFKLLYEERYSSIYDEIDIKLFIHPLRREENYFPEYYFLYMYDNILDSFNNITHLNIKSFIINYFDNCKSDYDKYYIDSISQIKSHFYSRYFQFLE